jgi:hypothetical protein
MDGGKVHDWPRLVTGIVPGSNVKPVIQTMTLTIYHRPENDVRLWN